MRIKLGPYKVTPEFWKRLQSLPGENDEQRTLMALEFAMQAYNDPRLAEQRRKAIIEDELRRVDQEVRDLVSPPVQIVPDDEPLRAGSFLISREQEAQAFDEGRMSFEPERIEASKNDPHAFETGPSLRCVFDKESDELRPATPEEIAEQDAAPKLGALVVTGVDHEEKTITLDAATKVLDEIDRRHKTAMADLDRTLDALGIPSGGHP